jgi:predicted small secreted protein
MKKIILLVCTVLFNVLLLSGCATVQMAVKDMDLTAKEFKAPTNGKAGIYIYRSEVFGAAFPMYVSVDDYPIGSTAAKTYHYVEVSPGYHIIKGRAENDSFVGFDFLANKLYYIWQEVKMGLMVAGNELHLVDEAIGQKGVLESKLAVSNPTPKR